MRLMEKTEGEDALERDSEDLDVTQEASEKQRPAESSAGPSTVVPPAYLLQTRAPIAARYLNVSLLYSRHPNFFSHISHYSYDVTCVTG